MSTAVVNQSRETPVKPYIPTMHELKNEWVQTAEGVYVSPQLARNGNGNRIVNVNWYESLDLARLVSKLGNATLWLASYGEELEAIKSNKKAAAEADSFGAWTRNRYGTIEAEDGRRFTRIYSHGLNSFADLDAVLTNGYISNLHELGAPDSVSEQPNPDFLGAELYYRDNPVVRGWGGWRGACAGCGALGAAEDLGFRLVRYVRKEAEKFMKEQNRLLRGENARLLRNIMAAQKELK